MKTRFHTCLALSCVLIAALLPNGVFGGQINLSAPVGSVNFGESVTALPSGNIVVTDPGFITGTATAAGAVHVFSPNGVLLSTLTGATNDDRVGGRAVTDSILNAGITVLANGNFVVVSPAWHGGAEGTVVGAGAVTWVNGATGLPLGATGSTAVVSAANSLVGTQTNDSVGGHGITPLPSGHFVVTSGIWDNGDVSDAGAATWGNGITGDVVGPVSPANSLVGSIGNDLVGYYGIVVLANGNYVVVSANWDNGGAVNSGAVTWGSATTGVHGPITATNSLLGASSNDQLGVVTPLTNGNYVVSSSFTDLAAVSNVGSATWAKGTGGTVGVVSAANSLVGSSPRDYVGLAVVALSNGNYVVRSEDWNGGVPDGVGAVTWGNGSKGTFGVVGIANSLVGTKVADHVGSAGVVALTNGNYVVASDLWDGSTPSNAGAATWGNGATGVTGQISAANSLVGSQTDDQVAGGGVVALSNGNYVVISSAWKNGVTARAGAVTWGNGATGIKGAVTTANSLFGDKVNDLIGSTGVKALTNGNYVVSSERWGDGTFSNVGAVTWGDGATGIRGLVSAANSLVGSHTDDKISGYNNSGYGIVPLVNGNYVVVSPRWNNGAASDVGAVTWASGAAASSGPLSGANSLIGSVNASAGVVVSSGQSVFPLANGNYVVTSPFNDVDGFSTTGAVTWGNGTTGISGPISLANSLNGAAPAPAITGITILANGDYIVHSPTFGIYGAVTLGDGNEGTVGNIAATNSVLGVAPQVGKRTTIAYTTHWKQLVVGQPDCKLVTVFTYPAPELTVEQPLAVVIADGGSTDFGGLVLGTNTSLEFTVTNTGSTAFPALTLTKGGSHSDDFTIVTPPAGTLAPGASTTFTLMFAPLAPFARIASVHLNTGAFRQSSFDVVVTGTGITPVPPSVTTLAVNLASIGVTTTTVKGSVNANNGERTAVFQFGKAVGTTINYTDEVAATPNVVTGTTVTEVSAALTSLEPHTKYNYRVKAFGFLGEATGANMTFTTADSAPIASDDPYVILPGAKATLDVLTNDTDPDSGDVLSLVSITALNPKTAGTIAKVGNTVVFTASATFAGAATFDYVAKDAFGKSDTGSAMLTPGSCTLDPGSKNGLLSEAGSYTVQVNVTGDSHGFWSVAKPPPWITVTPMSGIGDGQVTVAYQPNAAKTDRPGIITIGGQNHTLTQSQVVTPAISAPTVPKAVVGDFFTMTIPTTGEPVTYTVTNMPAGLKMDNATGTISGIPTKGIPYIVKVKAANAAGPAPVERQFTIDVQPLATGTVGSFHGFIKREGATNGGLGSRLELTTTPTGAFSGKIITGAASQAVKGAMKTFPNAVPQPKIYQAINSHLILDLTLSGDDDNLSGTYGDGGSHDALVTAWHNPWTSANRAAAFTALHTFSLIPGDADPALPQGYGFGSFSGKDTSGAITVAGKLADGSTFTTVTFVSKDGKLLIYQPLYGNKGSFAGILSIHPGTQKVTTAGNELTWFKPAPANLATSTDTIYKGGFGPLAIVADGGTYTPPAKGKVVMNLLNYTPLNAQLDFTPNGLDAHFTVDLEIDNPGASGLSNKVKTPIPGNAAYKVNMPALTAATGQFSGDFTLTAVPAANTRKVPFSGVIVNGAAGAYGYGCFLTPEAPDAAGETIAKTPKTSGRVLLKALITEPP